jgi:hypothetical protein
MAVSETQITLMLMNDKHILCFVLGTTVAFYYSYSVAAVDALAAAKGMSCYHA